MSENLYIKNICKKSKIAALSLSNLSIDKKNSVLKKFSYYLEKNKQSILRENKKDLFKAKSNKINNNLIDRLKLDNEKIKKIINSIG